MKNPLTAKRLSSAMAECGYRPQDLSNLSGVSKSSISHYLNGTHAPSNLSSSKMGKVLNKSPLWLMGFDVPETEAELNKQNVIEVKSKSKGIKIPVLGEVAAGIPIEAIEDILDYEEIGEDMARRGEFFGLRINGDSMMPRICKGDVVIVRQQPVAETGDTVIVRINGDSATCKRLRKYADGALELISTNPSYEPMFFSKEEVLLKPVEIIGKVIENRQKFE